MRLPALALGTQGWAYPDWVGPMYDAGTRSERFLREYAREFASVEVDATWYAVPTAERVRAWCAAVPDAFTFALKVPREITHERRLVACDAPLLEFAERARAFGTKLEGALVQLPPDFTPVEEDALAAFVRGLPGGIRWSIELRDPGWFHAEPLARVRALLGAAGVALAATDGTFVALDTMLAVLEAPTARHAYVRWLGAHAAVTRYDRVVFDRHAEIARWAHAIRAAAPQLERLCGYAGNYYSGHAPATVRDVYRALGVPHAEPPRIEQTALF